MKITKLNAETIKAIEDAERNRVKQRIYCLDEMWKEDLEKED